MRARGRARRASALLSAACVLSLLARATGQDPPLGSVCSEEYPASCANKCTLDGQRASPCPYECFVDTGVCYNYCDGYFSDGTVAYSNENSPGYDVYVPECAARIATQAAAAYVADAFTSNLRDPPIVRRGLSSTPFSMFRNGPTHSGRSAFAGPVQNVTVNWKFQTGGRVFSSPTLAEDGTVYVGCADGFVYGVFSDGSVKWKYPAGGAVVSTAAIGNPIGSDPTLFIGGADGTLHAVSANYGTSKWNYVKRRLHLDGAWQLKAKKPIVSSAALGDDGVVYVGADNSLFAIHAATGGGGFAGTVKWSYETRGLVMGSPALDFGNERVFVGSMAGTVHAVRAADGASLWSFDAEGGLYSSPALDDLGNVYVGGVDSYLYALRADTGLLKWKFRASAAIYSSPATAPSKRFPGGLVFVGATDWKLYAVRADDGLLAWNQTLRRSSSGQTAQEESLEESSDVTTNVTTNTSNVTSNVTNVTNASTPEVSYYATAAKTPYVSSSVRERADAARVLEAEGVCPPNLAQGVGEETSLRFGANVVLTCGRDSRSVGVVASPVYAVGSNSLGDDLGVVYVGSSDKSFYAVTAETGKVKWRLDVDGAVATSAAIDADGRLYFATDTGVVYQVAENATAESGTESELV